MGSLRTLVIAESLPYPPLIGKDLRNWQNIYGLSAFSDVGVFGLCSNDSRRDNIPPVPLALWHATNDPALAFPIPNQKIAARAWPLNPQGSPADLYFTEDTANEVAKIMTSFRPQLVVLEGMWPYRYLDMIKRFDCRIIMDCHNVEGAVAEEIANKMLDNDPPTRLLRKLLPIRTKMIEQKTVQAADQLWVCSDCDARRMVELYEGLTPIQVIPNAIDVSSYEAARARRYERPPDVKPIDKVLIFPALFGYQPNIVAASFLIKEFVPRLTKLIPDCQLLLAGSRPSPEMIEAGKKHPRIVVTEAVADMKPYLSASSVMVVPLFQGGGTRFKILEAFAANLPVVSTSKGAEGLAVQDGKHLLIAENVDEFIAGVRRIWTEPELANHLKANALELVERHYSLTAVSEKIRTAVENLNLAARLDN